jgi:hypothetical protein
VVVEWGGGGMGWLLVAVALRRRVLKRGRRQIPLLPPLLRHDTLHTHTHTHTLTSTPPHLEHAAREHRLLDLVVRRQFSGVDDRVARDVGAQALPQPKQALLAVRARVCVCLREACECVREA